MRKQIICRQMCYISGADKHSGEQLMGEVVGEVGKVGAAAERCRVME